MPRKTDETAVLDETATNGGDLLTEFAADAEQAAKSKKQAKEKLPESERKPREKAAKPEKPAKTLADVVAAQEGTPSPWIIMRLLEIAQRRVAVASPDDHMTIEQALGDVAGLYAQLAADAVALSREAGVQESSAASTGRLMAERFEHMLPRIGQVFGQPKRSAPYTRNADGTVSHADETADTLDSEFEPVVE